MNRIKVVYTGDQLYSIKHKILKPYRYNKFEIDLQLTTAWFVKLYWGKRAIFWSYNVLPLAGVMLKQDPNNYKFE